VVCALLYFIFLNAQSETNKKETKQMNEIGKLQKKLKKIEVAYAKAAKTEQVVIMVRLLKRGTAVEKRIKFLKGDDEKCPKQQTKQLEET